MYNTAPYGVLPDNKIAKHLKKCGRLDASTTRAEGTGYWYLHTGLEGTSCQAELNLALSFRIAAIRPGIVYVQLEHSSA